MIPERSENSKFAKSVFYEDKNDIDVYIEDTAFGYEKIFVEILKRVFGGRLRISKVFPLGPRNSVVSKCQAMQQQFIRPTLFIVDGDLFMLAGDPVPPLDGLYKLPFYCIENILIDAEAIHHILNEEEPIKSRQEIINEFSFENWSSENVEPLIELFIEYALSFKFNPSIQTVAYSVTNLVSSNTGYVDKQKIRLRIEELKKSTKLVVGSEKYLEARQEMLRRIDEGGEGKLQFVSGKDYLLPLLKTRLKSIVRTKIPDINLKLRLAMKCSVESIQGIEDQVPRIIENKAEHYV